jgi:hypothetical protein
MRHKAFKAGAAALRAISSPFRTMLVRMCAATALAAHGRRDES